MVRTLAKISLVLLIIVALPMSFYLVREYSALSKNEEMVERVFSTQLESILFSVNHYTGNVLTQWSQSLNQPVAAESDVMQTLVGNLFRNYQAITAIRFLDLDNHKVLTEFSRATDSISFNGWPDEQQVKTMREYLADNYQRINASTSDSLVQYCFLPINKNGKEACQILVRPDIFVDQNLRAQVQQISQEIFYIQIRDKVSGSLLLTTDLNAEPADSLQTADMWYLPGYEMGIRLKAKTIYQLASERTQRDNYLLLGMALLVFLGFVFVVVSIRKEIKLSELKSEFVSSVSHEIRTPLALISMYSETLLMKRVKTEAKQEEYLNTIHKESVRLTGIVNRILNFSRMEKNRQTYKFEPVDLSGLVPQVLTSIDAHLETANVDCRFDSEAKNTVVMADRESVKDMIVNLVDNAIKYGADNGKKIRIRLINRKKEVWLEVEDNGIGISAKHQKYVFDQFFRVTEGDLAHKAKGSGLGLNLVKRMMKAHGGNVSVRSKLGAGSTFILKFPVKNLNHV